MPRIVCALLASVRRGARVWHALANGVLKYQSPLFSLGCQMSMRTACSNHIGLGVLGLVIVHPHVFESFTEKGFSCVMFEQQIILEGSLPCTVLAQCYRHSMVRAVASMADLQGGARSCASPQTLTRNPIPQSATTQGGARPSHTQARAIPATLLPRIWEAMD